MTAELVKLAASKEELLYLADQQAYARCRYAEEDAGLVRESMVIEHALRFAAQQDGVTLTDHEMNLVRQWYNALNDLNPTYLEKADHALGKRAKQHALRAEQSQGKG